MPTSITQEFNINPEIFYSTGAFNAILDIDSNFFIHPDLLKTTKIPELQGSYKSIHNHFGKIMKLLFYSSSKGDNLWRKADKLLTFPEFKGLCIGYSRKGTGGSGMGRIIREQLLETAKQIIDLGFSDPEIFELVGLFEENIGCDRISDMLGKIIRSDLLKFSQRVFKDLEINGEQVKINGEEYLLPLNRFNNQLVVLLPEDILDTLPEALSWDDISKICSKNKELRQKVNAIIGYEWSEKRKRLKKAQLKILLLKNPEILSDLLSAHKGKKFVPYDFENDPDGEISWHRIALDYAEKFPLSLFLKPSPTIGDVVQVVYKICNQFSELVEKKGLWKNLYNPETDRPFHESYAQRLFYTVAICYCKANDLDISPESDGGQGPVDFKISAGYDAKVVVELKLSTNRNLIHGYENQLPSYQTAEGTKKGIYLVLDFGVSPWIIKRLLEVKNKNSTKYRNLPEIMLVDAAPKKSASRL